MDLSDEEKHALELRRERSNKISKLMGDYLLKGYKMMGSTCNKCGTILMRDRQQNDHCVSCNDIDGPSSINDMDAVMSRIVDETREHSERNQGNRSENLDRGERNQMAMQSLVANSTDDYRGIVKDIESSVLGKMRWAGIQLQVSGLEDSIKLLSLINACQETLERLQTST